MNAFLVIAVGLGLLSGAASYFSTNNLYIAVGVFLAFALCIWLLGGPIYKKFLLFQRKRHECFRFINSFVVTLSVSKSIDFAYNHAVEGLGKEVEDLSRSISELSGLEKVEYLDSYFEMPIYRMFVSTLMIYLNEGGDIINLSSDLLSELTRFEESENDVLSANRKNLVQYCMLWGISLGVVVFMRVALANFFELLVNSPLYLGCVIGYFALMLISIIVYVSIYTGFPLCLPFVGKSKIRASEEKGANA